MTPLELVEMFFDRGGSIWVVDDNENADPIVRHKGATKKVIAALRAVPIVEVIEAIRTRERKLYGAKEWFFQDLVPITAAQTSVRSLLEDYQGYCASMMIRSRFATRSRF